MDSVGQTATITKTGSQVQYELTICTATGLTSALLGGPVIKPRFFVSTQDGPNTLFRTATSERTLTPEWNEVHILSVAPSQILKLELFRDSSIRSDKSLGSSEVTMGQLEQVQTPGQAIVRNISGGVNLTLRCRRLDTRPSTTLSSEAQPHRARGSQSTRSGSTLEPRLRTEIAMAPESQPKNELTYGAGLRTFALVIGIDEYTSDNKPQLQGAARDARKMHELLRMTFGVPESHIRLLCNRDATRSRILDEFKALSTNPKIHKGDAIIIFFAGHGSRAPAPPEWKVNGEMVETICPVDEEFQGGPSEIHGIPDRTIGALVYKLSQVKGDNITLIFDCCHSGGIARGDAPKELWRAAKTTLQVPSDLDKDIWGDLPLARGGSQKKGFSASLSNYVLLAACRSEERAMETLVEGKSYGAFSTALFRHLRRSSSTTYSKLLQSVAREFEGNSHSQHPICEGDRRGCQMFDGLATRRDGKLFTLTIKEGRVNLNVGSIHGITVGCRLGLRRLDADSGAFLEVGFLEVKSVSVGSSVLEAIAGTSLPVITEDCMAFVEVWGDSEHLLDVSSDALQSSWMQPSVCRPRYRATSSRSQRTLVVREATGRRISFERGSPIAAHRKGLLQPPLAFTPWTLQHALNSIGDFHFHLNRNNPLVTPTLKDTVKLGIHKLEGGIKAQNLFPDNGTVLVKPGVDFFFTITNESPHDIFPYLFYFDPTDYSIQNWYYPPQENGRAPLPAGDNTASLLRVGFGGDSFDFTIPEGATSDLGFVKLFVSTCEVDMDSLVQDSPFLFAGNEQAAASSGISRGAQRKKGPNQSDSWDAYTYTVDIRQSI